ncbi:MAG: DNA polymerase III subunit alpha [Candidatus Levybacteria bacterium]|nr:DNA polymerase III subunit alpha [Candidatus Levybacteria bacterium]
MSSLDNLLDISKKLEGVARHASVHAAGVVIADKDLVEYTPIQRETNGEKVVTQYDMYMVGEDGVGLLKMDFLGLRNLTIIEETLKFIKQNQNQTVDLNQVPLDDKLAYELLGQGETTGIFQLESAGMRRYIKELKPTSIFDLQAMVALYRPGPMQNIPEFIARKRSPELITYPHEKLEVILKESYGVLTFQDDVLLTAIILAGYSWLDADKFRKAMGKKIPSEMKKQEEMFIDGCQKNGISEKKAKEIFDLIAPFAGYGFNKAHAACYAMIAFRTAYLKAHFPVEFMTAVLTAESRGTTGPQKNEKISQAVAECRRLDVPILQPDINASNSDFSIENNTAIRFGLSAIKNVGSAAIDSIIAARSTKKFVSVQDFCSRVDLGKVNKKTLESLIKAGAFDSFGNRASLLISMPDVVAKIAKSKKNESQGQSSLFDNEESQDDNQNITYFDVDDFSLEEKLSFEKEFLGFYLTSHPHMETLSRIRLMTTHEIELIESEKEGTLIKIGGIIEAMRKIVTKKSNAEMAFITIGDDKGITVECVVFPKVFEESKTFLITDSVILIEGRLDSKDEQPVVIANKISSAKDVL